MPLHDFLFVLNWWAVLFSIGAIFFPVTAFLFRNFFDRGYIFSKILGVIVTSYIVLLLGVLHLVVFSQLEIFFILVLFAVGQFVYLARKKRTSSKKLISFFFSPTSLIIVVEEVLFLATLLFWSFVRAHQPDIHNLEKFMDFGFVNSILRADYFPPKDMWMTPLSINYYYFGHLATAVLTKLSGIPSNISFNLMLATLFALTATAGFSLGGNFWTQLLKHKDKAKRLLIAFLITGLLSGFVLSSAGNLHTLYSFFTPYENDHPVPLWQLKFSPGTFPNNYWYPNATRYIYHTIHEFPIYSFVVSDLHGHVVDIPFVLLTIALLFSFFLAPKPNLLITKSSNFLTRLTTYIPFFWYWLLISFLLAVMYMTNALDGIIYLLLAGVCVFVLYKKWFGKNIFTTLFQTPFFTVCVVLLVSFVIFSLPFSLFFKSFVSQIGIVCPPAFLLKVQAIGPFVFEPNHCDRSPWWQLLILYGFFGFWVICLITTLLRTTKRTIIDLFMIILAGVSILLIIIPEFFYLRDIYTTYYRANTMFKLVYQSFMMLSLVSVYSLCRTFSAMRLSFNPFKMIGQFLIVVIGITSLILVAIYPYFAIGSYYDNFKTYYGLDGTTWIGKFYPDDYAAITWINSHISGQPVMLEAQGDSYTDYERISANTGLPTVIGWTVHEWLWRGTYDVVPPRMTDVQTIYETHDLATTKSLLQKYHISYVYVGDIERKKYPSLSEEKFATLGQVVFHQGTTTMYQLSF